MANALVALLARTDQEVWHGRPICFAHWGIFRSFLGIRRSLRESVIPMSTMTILGGVVAVLLLGYLVFALLAPEKLS